MRIKNHPVVQALRELVRLRDLKTDARQINTSGDWNAVHRQRDMLAEYDARRGDAWDAARRALHEHDVRAAARSEAEEVSREEFVQMLELLQREAVTYGHPQTSRVALDAARHDIDRAIEKVWKQLGGTMEQNLTMARTITSLCDRLNELNRLVRTQPDGWVKQLADLSGGFEEEPVTSIFYCKCKGGFDRWVCAVKQRLATVTCPCECHRSAEAAQASIFDAEGKFSDLFKGKP